MGGGRFDDHKWDAYSRVSKTSTAAHGARGVYAGTKVNEALDPKNIKIRESRDSAANPNSTAIIIGLDMTGSMDSVLEQIVTKDLGVAFRELYTRKPVTDPHVCLMMFDDVEVQERGVLQVSQFEAEVDKLTEQIGQFMLTHNGGGNSYESYHLPLYMAATKTSIDCFEKRKKKGYLFTIGDEQVPEKLRRSQINQVFGAEAEADLDYKAILRMAERMYHVFHIMVEEGDHMQRHAEAVKASWRKTLGERALLLTDHTKLGEVIVAAIQRNEGTSLSEVLASWSGDTSLVVQNAIKDLTPAGQEAGGVTTL